MTSSVQLIYGSYRSDKNKLTCESSRFLGSTKPVSYTHLDVYKRQGVRDFQSVEHQVMDDIKNKIKLSR